MGGWDQRAHDPGRHTAGRFLAHARRSLWLGLRQSAPTSPALALCHPHPCTQRSTGPPGGGLPSGSPCPRPFGRKDRFEGAKLTTVLEIWARCHPAWQWEQTFLGEGGSDD